MFCAIPDGERLRVSGRYIATLNSFQSGSRLLPLIGEGWDGEYPVRDLLCRHSGLRAGVPCKSSEGFKIIQSLTKCPTMRFRVAARNDKKRIIVCAVHGNNISTPHSNSLPIGRENKMPLHNSSNYATLNRVQCDRKEYRHSGPRAGVPFKLRGF